MRPSCLAVAALCYLAVSCDRPPEGEAARRPEYKSGFEEGFTKASGAGGRRVPTPVGRSEEYQRGFDKGWHEGLKQNPRIDAAKEKKPR